MYPQRETRCSKAAPENQVCHVLVQQRWFEAEEDESKGDEGPRLWWNLGVQLEGLRFEV